ncbi:RING-H2 finger protein ATL2 [Linum grandiflorum]
MSDLLNSISSSSSSSYDSSSNLLLAAFISLLLVILFVLLLHIYAKWYLSRRMRTTTVITSSLTLHPSSSSSSSSSVINYRYHFRSHSGSELQADDPASAAGLHPSVIASIPLFVYINSRRPSNGGSEISWLADEESKNKMSVVVQHQHQCVICLSGFGDGEVGRCLSGCGHGFHVECIDMWLLSHSSCPICRSPAAPLPLPLPPAAVVDSKAAGGEEEEEEEVAVLISSASGRSEEADDHHHRHDNVQCVSQ